MPNRVLKDSITCSKQIDSLTWFQEVMFYRLIVKADDFGRYYADPQIIKSELFPRKEDLTKKAVAEGLDVLERIGLIGRYQWDETDYLQITKWEDHQQRRATKSKFPDSNGNHMISNDIKCNQKKSNDINRNQMHPNTNTKSNTKTKTIHAREGDAPLDTDENLSEVQKVHNEILDRATEIGLPNTQFNRDMLIDLFVCTSYEAVMYGLNEAARMNKVSPAYIKTVANNYRKDKPKADDNWEDEVMQSVVWG